MEGEESFGPEIYWVPDLPGGARLALMPCPRGDSCLAGEVAGLHEAGVQLVVSLIEDYEAYGLGVREEGTLCAAAGIDFLRYPILDGGVPESMEETATLVRSLAARALAGTAIAIHCRAGIGRTSLIAGCILLALGVPAADVLDILGRARGFPVPDTWEQEEWLRAYYRWSLETA